MMHRALSDIGNLNLPTRIPSGTGHTLIKRSSFSTNHLPLPPPPSPRVDSLHRDDPQCVVDYTKEIHEHFRRNEGKFKPSVTYMGRQAEISESMRAILVDWLVEVHSSFSLSPETLYLTVDILDRFLDQRKVQRSRLQLAGMVALLLGAKYEEIYPPDIEKLVHISARAYTREEIVRWERLALTALDYNLTVPTLYNFLKRGLQVMDADATTSFVAHYFSELALLEYKMLAYLPSTTAAACIYLANKVLGAEEAWTALLEYYTHYRVANFERCANDLLEHIRNVPETKQQAITKKYNHEKRGAVARFVHETLAARHIVVGQ